jgi:hypothetical protein
MEKHKLKKFGIDAKNIMSREEKKRIFAGDVEINDGFDCAWYYQRCDRMYPDRYDMFNWCMQSEGCA